MTGGYITRRDFIRGELVLLAWHAGKHRRNGETVGRNERTLDGHGATVGFDLTEETDPGCYAEMVQPDGTRWTGSARHLGGQPHL